MFTVRYTRMTVAIKRTVFNTQITENALILRTTVAMMGTFTVCSPTCGLRYEYFICYYNLEALSYKVLLKSQKMILLLIIQL